MVVGVALGAVLIGGIGIPLFVNWLFDRFGRR